LIPRSHRGIFVINELPDLQARIQVALFNILQESDIQIRGFKVRLPLDIQFIFTANPEDYTNRGSIVTPLKDRIDSQILTHYPRSLEISKKITKQEANISQDQKEKINSEEFILDLVEQIAFEARASEYIDSKSGVSARLTISSYENLMSTAERRRIINKEKETHLRVSDIYGVIPSITGKIELVYEGEQEGPAKVAQILIGKALRSSFIKYFPAPDSFKSKSSQTSIDKKTDQTIRTQSPFQPIVDWFKKGNKIDLMINLPDKLYKETLHSIPCLEETVKKFHPNLNGNSRLLLMEFLLFGLSEYSLLSRSKIEDGIQFKDMLSSMFTMPQDEDIEDEEDSSSFKY
ncbi:MAG: magnesium chelatase, partial [Ignavibacteriales bacterium]